MNAILLLVFLMATGSDKRLSVIPEDIETITDKIEIYAPPATEPVKKRKIFFIAGADPKDNQL